LSIFNHLFLGISTQTFSPSLPHKTSEIQLKDNGITNDANDWGLETENNPKVPLELFHRIITVSLETLKIVESMPEWVSFLF